MTPPDSAGDRIQSFLLISELELRDFERISEWDRCRTHCFRTRSPGFKDRQILGVRILLPITTLADPAEEIPLAFETDRTLVAKAVRHSRFFARYVRARYHRKDLDGLMAAVARRFPDSKGWIAERRLELRKTVGPLRNKDGIHWGAPIVAVITYHDRHGEQKEACGMSLYIENNSLYILQLQGGKLVTFPRRFKVWPQLFLKSCIRLRKWRTSPRCALLKQRPSTPIAGRI